MHNLASIQLTPCIALLLHPAATCTAGLAAVLPCFVVYLEVGKALKQLGERGRLVLLCQLGWTGRVAKTFA